MPERDPLRERPLLLDETMHRVGGEASLTQQQLAQVRHFCRLRRHHLAVREAEAHLVLVALQHQSAAPVPELDELQDVGDGDVAEASADGHGPSRRR